MSGLATLPVFPPSTFSAAYHWGGINIHLIKIKAFPHKCWTKANIHRKNKKGNLNTNLLHNVANLLLLAVKLLMRLSGIRPVSLESFINIPQKCSFIYGYVVYLIICTSPLAIHSFCKFVNKKSKFRLIMCMTKCFYDTHMSLSICLSRPSKLLE